MNGFFNVDKFDFSIEPEKAKTSDFITLFNIAQYFNLIGGILIAGDSTKLRTRNSKKNNYNQKKIDRHPEYIKTSSLNMKKH